MAKTLVKVKVQGNNAVGNAVWNWLLKRCEEFKIICMRLNSMPQNRHIANRLERYTIGILSALAILNPFFWVFGIKGVVISLKILEKAVVVVKFTAKFVWASIRKTVRAIAVIGILCALIVQDLIRAVKEHPFIFISLAFLLVWCLAQTPAPTF